MNDPALQQTSLVLQFKNRVNAAAAVALGLPQHVPGMAINGDALREFSSTPFLVWPLGMPAVRGGVSVRRRLRFAPGHGTCRRERIPQACLALAAAAKLPAHHGTGEVPHGPEFRRFPAVLPDRPRREHLLVPSGSSPL